MAAAGRAPGRSCCRRRWRPSRRCPMWCMGRTASRWSSMTTIRRRPARRFGRLKGFHGQMGMFVRALAYMMSHGADGLRQVAEDAVLNANYILASLEGRYVAGLRRALHARGAVRRRLPEGHRRHHARHRQGDDRRGLSPDDHVFPAGRPRRAADRADGDREQGFARPVHRGDEGPGASGRRRATRAYFHGAPRLSPRRRLDETAAARKPVLRWRPSNITGQAAE